MATAPGADQIVERRHFLLLCSRFLLSRGTCTGKEKEECQAYHLHFDQPSRVLFHKDLRMSGLSEIHSKRRACMGSTRVARQAGKKQAINETTVRTKNAYPKASRSYGLTL